jgi:hypothetical protein
VANINRVAENRYEGIVFGSGSAPILGQGAHETATIGEKVPD